MINAETGEKVGALDSVNLEVSIPAGVYEVKFGPASWKGIEVFPGETTTIEPAELEFNSTVFADVTVVNSETGENHGSLNRMSTKVTLMPGTYDLKFSKSEWRFIKVEGGKVTKVRPAAVILKEGLEWSSARVTTADGQEVVRFDAVSTKVALPPGNYIVEVDGNKLPFHGVEGEEFVVEPE